MSSSPEKTPFLLCVCGPTATGKTDLAFILAQTLKTEIVSFDSVQVYQELDIGTAKPSKSLREKIRHHLIDEVSPREIFTAGDFRRRALEIINQWRPSDVPLIFVGGTGFYLQALLKGMYSSPAGDAQIRSDLEKRKDSEGLSVLYEELLKRDPEHARKIHPHDQYRILRGLEVMQATGKTMTAVRLKFQEMPAPFSVLQVGLKREKKKLLEAVTQRTESMIHQGLVDETQRLVEKYGPDLRPLESVGYHETMEFLQGRLPREALMPAIVKSTMALAKRQKTWFQRDSQIQWFDPDCENLEQISKRILDQWDSERRTFQT